MPTPRRNLVRSVTAAHNTQHQRRLVRLRARLDQQRTALARWQVRLKRAFRAVERSQVRVIRLERQFTQLEGN